jgi:hypothetical protein
LVFRVVGKGAVPMIIIMKGNIDYNNLKGDLNNTPAIDENFLKNAEETMSKTF